MTFWKFCSEPADNSKFSTLVCTKHQLYFAHQEQFVLSIIKLRNSLNLLLGVCTLLNICSTFICTNNFYSCFYVFYLISATKISLSSQVVFKDSHFNLRQLKLDKNKIPKCKRKSPHSATQTTHSDKAELRRHSSPLVHYL